MGFLSIPQICILPRRCQLFQPFGYGLFNTPEVALRGSKTAPRALGLASAMSINATPPARNAHFQPLKTARDGSKTFPERTPNPFYATLLLTSPRMLTRSPYQAPRSPPKRPPRAPKRPQEAPKRLPSSISPTCSSDRRMHETGAAVLRRRRSR